MSKTEKSGKGQWNILFVLGVFLTGLVFLFSQTMQSLNKATSDLTEIQYLNAGTQRCIRMVLNSNVDTMLIHSISKQTDMFLNLDSKDRLSVLENPDYVVLATNVLGNWNSMEELITEELPEEESLDTALLTIMIDSHFDSMTLLSGAINSEVSELNEKALNLQFAALAVFVLIGAIMSSNFLQTSAALKQNKELAKLAAIDTATGLFNRSKCQDLFKTSSKSGEKEFDAVIVIDLNDLKKTNDTLGHRVGDELIFNFARILKEACNVHDIKPFVGRYGGDEFVIYYRNVREESEIATFIKEVNFLADEFNNNETRFKISYASGYAMNQVNSKERNVRELFDVADENMYTNKQHMKRAKLEEHQNA